jgi:hypothetical protein
LLACSVAAILTLLATGSLALAQEAADDALCGVLTPEEVGAALGTTVETGTGWSYGGSATCNWIASDAASFAYADATWQDVPLELVIDGIADGTEVTVGGYPAYLAPQFGSLHIRLDQGLLTLSLAAESPDVDVAAALTALGEAAAPRAVSLPAPAPMATSDVEAPVAPADDPVADAFCALLTPEEVGAALGAEVTAAGSFESCNWSSSSLDGSFWSASAGWAGSTIDDLKTVWPEGVDLTVGGRPAYYAPDIGSLYVDTEDGVVMLTAFGFAADGTMVDAQAVLTGLGELTVERSGGLLPPAPLPTFDSSMFHQAPDLEALFPSSVAGQPITVQSLRGQAILDGGDEAFVRELEAMLAEQGRTLDDVSVAFGGAGDDAIIAVRVMGGDPSASATLLIEGVSGMEGIEPEAGQVAGKDVLIASAGEQTWYVYPQGETVWVIAAQEPALTEILTALP